MSIFFSFLLALVVLAIYCVPTILCAAFLRGKDTLTLSTITLGIWIVKFVILIGAFVLLKKFDFFNHQIFAVLLLIWVIIVTFFEVRWLRKSMV